MLTFVFDVPLTSISMNIRESDLFVGCTDGDIYRFNLHEPPRGIEHHVQIRKDGNSEGSISGEVHVWDIASHQILRTINHKGPITAAFFAKYYENFRVTNLKPCLQLCNLQRISDDTGKESSIDVISNNQNLADILNFELYTEKNVDLTRLEDSNSQKLVEMKEEIDRLKKINTAIYQYSVKHILNKSNENISSV